MYITNMYIMYIANNHIFAFINPSSSILFLPMTFFLKEFSERKLTEGLTASVARSFSPLEVASDKS